MVSVGDVTGGDVGEQGVRAMYFLPWHRLETL